MYNQFCGAPSVYAYCIFVRVLAVVILLPQYGVDIQVAVTSSSLSRWLSKCQTCYNDHPFVPTAVMYQVLLWRKAINTARLALL